MTYYRQQRHPLVSPNYKKRGRRTVRTTRRSPLKICIVMVLLVLVSVCTFVVFEKEKTERMIEKARYMKLEVTPDDTKVEFASSKIKELLAAAKEQFSSWIEDLAKSEDTEPKLRNAGFGIGQSEKQAIDGDEDGS